MLVPGIITVEWNTPWNLFLQCQQIQLLSSRPSVYPLRRWWKVDQACVRPRQRISPTDLTHFLHELCRRRSQRGSLARSSLRNLPALGFCMLAWRGLSSLRCCQLASVCGHSRETRRRRTILGCSHLSGWQGISRRLTRQLRIVELTTRGLVVSKLVGWVQGQSQQPRHWETYQRIPCDWYKLSYLISWLQRTYIAHIPGCVLKPWW